MIAPRPFSLDAIGCRLGQKVLPRPLHGQFQPTPGVLKLLKRIADVNRPPLLKDGLVVDFAHR